MNVKQHITSQIKEVVDSGNISCDVSLSYSRSNQAGDYQTNMAFMVAKQKKSSPMEIAEDICEELKDCLGKNIDISITSPGFINFKLKNHFIFSSAFTDVLNCKFDIMSENIVIDYSHPNLAKEMHVGHLRSTIIGDCLARVYEYFGHKVIRQNHMGDWGTQFGMITAYLDNFSKNDLQINNETLQDLEELYKSAKLEFESNIEFANKARNFTVKLQNVDPYLMSIWLEFTKISRSHCQDIYDKLNITLTDKDIRPESYYNRQLSTIVGNLLDKGIAIKSDGAICVFFDTYVDDNITSPFMIQKSDKGYTYATTDLAALQYRNDTLKANKIIYVVDARQSTHFKQLFLTAKKAGLVKNAKLYHYSFGTMMDEHGKPFKTREGNNIKLNLLIDSAINKAKEVLSNRNVDDMSGKIAKSLAVGAIKYADLSKDRTNNYIFNLDNMLSFDGNTAIYLQYGYVRMHKILQKSGISIDFSQYDAGEYSIFELTDSERLLLIHITRFEETLDSVYKTGKPHILCEYLYNITKSFMSFYEENPVLKAEKSRKIFRLHICYSAKNIVKNGLNLLGVDTISEM